MVSRINGDLANDFGNLAQRVLSMIARNCGGQIPQAGELTESDAAILTKAAALLPKLREHYEQQAFHRALEAVWRVIGDANRYIDEQAPWKLRKTDPERMQTVLWVVAETVRRVALLTQPVMPRAMEKMLDQLAVPAEMRGFDQLEVTLQAGTILPAPEGVFPRYTEPEEKL